MNVIEVKAKAFDMVVSAYYGEKLSQNYIEALVDFIMKLEADEKAEPVKSAPVKASAAAEPVKEKKAPAKTTKKAEPKTERKPIDDDKIKACYEGGRSIAWIADEMGISQPTVRAHLKAMGF